MPYKSDKQRRYFHAAEERGEISPKVVHEFDEASKGMSLPEAIKKKKDRDQQAKYWRGGAAKMADGGIAKLAPLLLLSEGGHVLDAEARAHIAPHNFALSGERYPIHDIDHARNALARVAQNGTPEEKAKVRAAVHRKYPSIGEE